MKYDVVGKARRDYTILDNLPDNLDALQEAAHHTVIASRLSVETKAFLNGTRGDLSRPAAISASNLRSRS